LRRRGWQFTVISMRCDPPELRRARVAALATVAVAFLAVAAAGAVRAAGPSRPMERAAGSARLAGQLLVATSEMGDPRFFHAVIYMVQHDASGAMGLLVNRPVATVPLARLLADVGADTTGVSGTIRVRLGGPVEVSRGAVLHTAEYAAKETLRVTSLVSVTWEPEILRAIAGGTGPRRSLFALGYAGWGPGQLEAEITAGAWIAVPADEELVFGDNDEGKWEQAISKRLI
jgi:putative transcriptional regulator